MEIQHRACGNPKIIKHRKGLWSPEEDKKLINYVVNYGHGCWTSVPLRTGLQRSGKSCRLRWINYLRPGLKRGAFTVEEEKTIIKYHAILGNKWSQIAMHMPGRTDNEVKNYWNSYLKKKFDKSTSKDEHTSQSSDGSSPDQIEWTSTDSSRTAAKFECQSALPRLFFADWLSMDSLDAQSKAISSSCGMYLHANPDKYVLDDMIGIECVEPEESLEEELFFVMISSSLKCGL